MTKHIFLSYSSNDKKRADALERSLEAQKLQVWRDKHSINPSAKWFDAIEDGIRDSRGVVVLVTKASRRSEWVTYEYSLARGAGIPVIAILAKGTAIPTPLRSFQAVKHEDLDKVAEEIKKALADQSRAIGRDRASSAPVLIAKFQEENGEPIRATKGKTPELCIEMWLEQVPKETKSVAFEIPDDGVRDNEWTAKRASTRPTARERAFLCDDIQLYGDVEVWASGIGKGPGKWSGSWRLYEALMRYYRSRSYSPGIRAALKQIRRN
ncbi:hypothetical protein ACVIIV_007033 [Bradyrhizobium sp. USDA 4354]